MNSKLRAVTSLGAGAVAMYLFDPEQGRRRRASARDQTLSAGRRTGRFLRISALDLSHRMKGLAAEAGHMVQREEPSDEVLVQRVRSAIGRASSHPHAVHVETKNGLVRVSGPVLRHEAEGLLEKIRKVDGVKGIEDKLEVHKQPDRISSLQGGKPRGSDRFELMQSHWMPGVRLLVIAASAGPLLYGLRRRDALGAVIGLVSSGFLVRAVTNIEARRLLGLGGGRRAVRIRKTINFSAPIERVFGFWSDLENFRKFMPDIKSVDFVGNGRFHWVIAGPAGVPVSWDAVVTRREPNKLIAWRSEPGAAVQNAGRVQFLANEDGSTKIEIDLAYNPPAGALGHAVAVLFGSDPKSKMDQDLMRIKNLLEAGPAGRAV